MHDRCPVGELGSGVGMRARHSRRQSQSILVGDPIVADVALAASQIHVKPSGRVIGGKIHLREFGCRA